jgi:hypothetical protein
MLKKHYELRYNPDVEGKRVAAVLHIGEDRLPNDLFVIPDAAVEFGSIEEADMYLAASGFEKGEARRGETRPAFPLRRRRVQERPDVGGDAVFLIRWKRRNSASLRMRFETGNAASYGGGRFPDRRRRRRHDRTESADAGAVALRQKAKTCS